MDDVKESLEQSMHASMELAAQSQAEALRLAASGAPEPVVEDALRTAEVNTQHAQRCATVLGELGELGE